MKSNVGKYKAEIVTITDAGSVFTATDVEAALQEVRTKLNLVNSDEVYNCDSGVAVNDCVYLDSSSILQKASNNNGSTLPLFGVIRAKITSTSCQVQIVGERSGFSGLTVGSIYYLDVNGGVTLTAPTAPSTYIIPMGLSKNTSTIIVFINNRGIINT